MHAFPLPIGADPNDVLAAQTPLVHPRRGDPDVSIFVPDRNVTAGSGGHFVSVDALHDRDNLIARMKKGEGLHRLERSSIQMEHFPEFDRMG
jgi:hypothetical protein